MSQTKIFEDQLTTSVAAIDQQRMTRKIRIENPLGLHARPATFIVRMLKDTQSTVTFTFRRQTVDARSVLGLLMLAAPPNALITVSVDGPDAPNTMELIEEAFKAEFGELA